MPDEGSPLDDRKSILDAEAFRRRLDEEIARVRRSGGFLSLAVFHATPRGKDGATTATSAPSRIAERLRHAVRLEDVLAQRPPHVALLMPDTSAGESARAAERLLRLINLEAAAPERPLEAPACAGLATTYGEIEGGGPALLAAAEEALRQAEPGKWMGSKTADGRPRLLVVDDDVTFAKVLAESISEREWEAHPCTDVADARERARDVTYSGFFIDVVLPASSGVDILREAIAAGPGRPAVLMSGKDVDPALIVDALTLGPVMFIRKPLSLADLDAALAMFRQLVPGIKRRGRRGS